MAGGRARPEHGALPIKSTYAYFIGKRFMGSIRAKVGVTASHERHNGLSGFRRCRWEWSDPRVLGHSTLKRRERALRARSTGFSSCYFTTPPGHPGLNATNRAASPSVAPAYGVRQPESPLCARNAMARRRVAMPAGGFSSGRKRRLGPGALQTLARGLHAEMAAGSTRPFAADGWRQKCGESI